MNKKEGKEDLDRFSHIHCTLSEQVSEFGSRFFGTFSSINLIDPRFAMMYTPQKN